MREDARARASPRAPPSARAPRRARVSPESPSRPDSDSSACSISSSVELAACAAGGARSPASIEPERVAIGTPSSGLKPIVVSTERPSRTAVTEQPPPRWQTTSRGDAHLLGRPLHREAVEAVAADAPLVAPARRQRVRRRLVGHRRVERRVEDGDVRHVRAARACASLDRRQRRPRCAAARARRARSSAARTPSSTTTGSRKRAPPCTTRCATASTCRPALPRTTRRPRRVRRRRRSRA